MSIEPWPCCNSIQKYAIAELWSSRDFRTLAVRFATPSGGAEAIVMVMVIMSTPTWLRRPAFLRGSEDNRCHDIRH